MNEPYNESRLQAFIDRAVLEGYDWQAPPEPEAPKPRVVPEQRIVVRGRGRHDKDPAAPLEDGLPAVLVNYIGEARNLPQAPHLSV